MTDFAVRRLQDACTDAVDKLVRARDLYTACYADAAWPTAVAFDAPKTRTLAVSGSQPPGDLVVREALERCARAVAGTLEHLGVADLHKPATERPPSPGNIHGNVRTAVHLLLAVRDNAEQLDESARRRVHRACASARTAWRVWDTIPARIPLAEASAYRAAHGTVATPPSHWPGPNPARCRRQVDGKACGRLLEPGRRGKVCQVCANRDARRRRTP